MTEDLQQAIAGAERVFEVLDTEPDIIDAKDAKDLPEIKGKITFDHVEFQYVEGNDVLKDISFDVNPGEMVALVGPTGVGKTTLIMVPKRQGWMMLLRPLKWLEPTSLLKSYRKDMIPI